MTTPDDHLDENTDDNRDNNPDDIINDKKPMTTPVYNQVAPPNNNTGNKRDDRAR
jgi:hypothetical protein